MASNRKVLGCSDYFENFGSSYARQSRLVLEMLNDFDWTYVALAYHGPIIEMSEKPPVPRYLLYPQTFFYEPHEEPNLQGIINTEKPEAVWIYEDAQHVASYKNRNLTGAPTIGYFAWDVDYHGAMLDNVMHAVDVPVCFSDFAENLIHDHGYDVDKVYNCVDENAFGNIGTFEDDAAFIRNKLGIAPEKKIILYVGALHARKNPETLIAMARELKRLRGDDFVLVIHGNPDFSLMTCDIRVEVFSHGVQDVVMFTPHVDDWNIGIPPRSLNAIYNMADVFVSAHGGEGFGLPACEAGLCGKPFVMTDCTTTREFSDGGRNGVAVPVAYHRMSEKNVMPPGVARPVPDHVKFAEEVSALLDDGPRRRVMGQRFKEHVQSKYTQHVLAPKWKAVFEKCFANHVGVKEI